MKRSWCYLGKKYICLHVIECFFWHMYILRSTYLHNKEVVFRSAHFQELISWKFSFALGLLWGFWIVYVLISQLFSSKLFSRGCIRNFLFPCGFTKFFFEKIQAKKKIVKLLADKNPNATSDRILSHLLKLLNSFLVCIHTYSWYIPSPGYKLTLWKFAKPCGVFSFSSSSCSFTKISILPRITIVSLLHT